jgi:hypothetical protein
MATGPLLRDIAQMNVHSHSRGLQCCQKFANSDHLDFNDARAIGKWMTFDDIALYSVFDSTRQSFPYQINLSMIMAAGGGTLHKLGNLGHINLGHLAVFNYPALVRLILSH